MASKRRTIVHTNTLTENLADVQEKDRYDVVLANPPFGGKERNEVQQNFPIRTGETHSSSFQHFIKMIKAGGRGGVVIKNTFLPTPTMPRSACASCCWRVATCTPCSTAPAARFSGRVVKTVVLFFEKGAPDAKGLVQRLDPGP